MAARSAAPTVLARVFLNGEEKSAGEIMPQIIRAARRPKWGVVLRCDSCGRAPIFSDFTRRDGDAEILVCGDDTADAPVIAAMRVTHA